MQIVEKKILSFCLRERVENFILKNRDKNNYFSIKVDPNNLFFSAFCELQTPDQIKDFNEMLFNNTKIFHNLIDLDLRGSVLIGVEKKDLCEEFVSLKFKAGEYPFTSSISIPICIHQGITKHSAEKDRNHFYFQHEKSSKALSESYIIDLTNFSFLEFSETSDEFSDYVEGIGTESRSSVYCDSILKQSFNAQKIVEFIKNEYSVIPFSSRYYRTGEVSVVYQNMFNKLIEKNID